MRYSDWQIDKIRSRLVAYRYKKGQNGRPRPWKGVLYDILLCPDTAHVFPEDGSLPEFKEEALRRFAAGTSILTPDKIHDLRLFLVKEHFLKEKELDDAPYDIEEALTLHGYLASNSEGARDVLAKLTGSYVAEFRSDAIRDRISLKISLDESGDFLHVEDNHERYLNPDAGMFSEMDRFVSPLTFTRKDAYKSFEQKRTGFGFVSTEANLLHLFLWGPVKKDMVSCVQVQPVKSSKQDPTFDLLRNGSSFPSEYLSGLRADLPVYCHDVFRFVTEEAFAQKGDPGEIIQWGQKA